MKLATTTGDFRLYTNSQAESLRLIREAGFLYADYGFGVDYKNRSGVYTTDYVAYFDEICRTCDALGIQLVQAHSPMGKPLAEDNQQFIEDTLRCVDACGVWGIPNLVVHSGYARGLSVEETFVKNKEFYDDDRPLVEGCNCYACRNHSRAYIRHLWRCQEATAATLLSIHNIKYLIGFSQKCREAILNDKFGDFYNAEMKKIK